jgi:hypothetical protein
MGILLALAREQKSPPGQQIISVKRPILGVIRWCFLALTHNS